MLKTPNSAVEQKLGWCEILILFLPCFFLLRIILKDYLIILSPKVFRNL